MRRQQLIDHVTNTISAAFENDVADAILEHTDTVENLARHLGNTCGDARRITEAIDKVAQGLDDGTADWLVEAADNPAAWLYSQVR